MAISATSLQSSHSIYTNDSSAVKITCLQDDQFKRVVGLTQLWLAGQINALLQKVPPLAAFSHAVVLHLFRKHIQCILPVKEK